MPMKCSMNIYYRITDRKTIVIVSITEGTLFNYFDSLMFLSYHGIATSLKFVVHQSAYSIV